MVLKKQRAPDSYTNGNIQATAIKRVFRTKCCFKEKEGRESGKLRGREAWNKGVMGLFYYGRALELSWYALVPRFELLFIYAYLLNSIHSESLHRGCKCTLRT